MARDYEILVQFYVHHAGGAILSSGFPVASATNFADFSF
jgi:hypothetical protein